MKFSPVLTIATHCGRILQGCFSRIRGGGGIVSGKTPRLVGLIGFVVTLLVSGIDVGMPDTARADDCLTAPNSPAPQGTHWYYHVDRTNQRKCWYVRASRQPAQQAAAQATSEPAPAAQSHSLPVSSGPMPATAAASAPMSINPGNSAPPLPHARIRCRQAEASGRHQRDNGQICSGKRAGRKYRAVNSGAPGSESKHN